MNCPYCKKDNNNVSTTRNRPDGTLKRYRKCNICGRNFQTVEEYYSQKRVNKVRAEQRMRTINETRKTETIGERQ